MSGHVIRGSRLGSGPTSEAERGEAAPRIWVSFSCANRHETRPAFAADAEIPGTWDCPRCGNPAGQNEQDPPSRSRVKPYKTHLAYVKERRGDSDGETILAEALARRHGAASTRPRVPEPRPAARGTGGEGPDDRGKRERAGDDAPRPPHSYHRQAAWPRRTAGPAAGPAARSRPADPGSRRAGRPGPARRAGEGSHAAGQADGSADLVAGQTVAAQAQRTSDESPPAEAGPIPTGLPAGQRCGTCEYLLDSRSHKGICLGQW